MTKIIAMCGLKSAGKDTSADMLIYMLNTPKFMHKYSWYKIFGAIKGKWRKTSFARPLKQVLSLMINEPIEKFEDRAFKEYRYINLSTFEQKWYIEFLPGQVMSDNQFSKLLKNGQYDTIMSSWISIRQLMQYVGTNVCRQYISNDVWINATLQNTNNIVIADLRFKRECEIIKKHDGVLIYVSRPGCEPGNHASEREVYELYSKGEFEHVLQNNGTLKDLFYKIKNEIWNNI